ncbi:MAG: alpha-1,2-fucosyltransferase [Niabella sp.]
MITVKTVAISVRRGDFITNPNHYLLPFEYYFDAYCKFFPDYDIVIFTDDFKWCKKMFGKLKTVSVCYSDKYNSIEQLCFMSMFSNFIISNSTFSWWGAYLADPKNKTVIRPHYVFDGAKKTELNIKDHYPGEWIEFKHEEVVRPYLQKILFYNDNNYRLKSWSRKQLFTIYNKLPFKNFINKIAGKR